MESEKRKLLDSTHLAVLEMGIEACYPAVMTDLVSPDVAGFGTALDEKVFGIPELEDLIKRQKDQSEGIEIDWKFDILSIHISSDENSAVFSDDVFLYIRTEQEPLDMYIRFTMVLEYIENKWKLVHWHASKPEQVESEKDTWGIQSWKERAEILEKEVAERTGDLVLKNRELEIEAALERVRTRALAMNSSEELPEVALELRKQMGLLGQLDLEVCVIHLYEEGENYFESWGAMRAPGEEGKIFQGLAKFPNSGIAIIDEMMAHYHAGDKDYILVNEGEKAQEWFQVLKKYAPEIYRVLSKTFELTPKDQLKAYWAMADFEGGSLGMVTYAIPDPDSLKLLRQSANVFQLAHRRYRDLQKAEAQAREARIETALERTRTQSMLMQHSHELNEISKVFHEQLLSLGIDSEFSFVWLPDEEKVEHLFWATWQIEKKGQTEIQSKSIAYPMDLTEPTTLGCLTDWKSGVSVHEHFIPPSEINNFFASWEELLSGAEKLKPQYFPDGIYYTEAFMKYGCFGIDIRRPLSEKEKSILNRFAIEFERAYTRFLDLKKAEAQAREAQIEAALERVRSRTMGMQHSSELTSAATLLFQQIQSLGVPPWSCGFNIWEQGDSVFTSYMGGGSENFLLEGFKIPLTEEPAFIHFQESRDRGDKLFVDVLEGEALEAHYRYFFTLPGIKEVFEKGAQEGRPLPTFQINHLANFKHGNLMFITYEPCPEAHDIFIRFAKVFEQTYTRFLDLKKAEEQAKEAKIEVALEKVRSRTMGMRSSEELPEVANMLFLEVQALGINAWSCGYNILAEDRKTATCAMSSEGTLQTPFQLRLWGEASFDEMGEFIHNDEAMLVQELGGEALVEHYTYMKSFPDLKPTFDELDRLGLSLPTYQINHLCKFSHGFLLFITYEKVPDAHDIFKRFTKVFDQTYTRFLDLQKAEAQAREAQIEAALERVRSRTLAMQKSDELADTAAILFQQLIQLGIEPNRLYIGILKDNSTLAEFWTTEEDGTKISTAYTTDLRNNISLEKMYEAWKRKEKSSVVDIHGEELREYIKYLSNLNIPFKDGIKQTRRIQYLAYFTQGFIGMAAPDEQPKESMEILERFAFVFNLTFTRFNDLKKAEARARESKIDTALERVRSRTMAMQQSEELGDVASVLFNEMNGLVDDLWTCGFVLCEENRKEDEWWLSMDTGFTRGLFLPNEGDYAHETLYDGWKKGMSFRSVELEGKILNEHYEWLMKIPIAKQIFAEMEASGIPRPKWQKLHAAYFKTGYLVIITEVPCDEEDIFKRFAQVFDLTYTRFLDLQQKEEQGKKLVEEKIRLERTLKDLQATQAQLIHAEKMASLGELTAGIAHEIQNPLNFVNNFAEVSTELIDEVEEERQKKQEERDEELVSDLMVDLKENLKKINHHGKRAGEIVKGMLQHSRAGSGEKELTDINALADEYFRLAYHGLRAKDKSFNAFMESDFEAGLPKLNLVPQDIGRVLLNLITNAFYAVNEKSKQGIEGYEPTVSVNTKKVANKVQITVKDNGNGIPEAIKDKIFQPFFTTKPTGSGTGLGLSLSYDIVKAHGGELKVETKEGEGSIFIIQFPI